MEIINTVSELRDALNKEKMKKKSIGFVPTMGALHAGHIQLIKHSVAENDISVVSIFVNPTQFNDKNDLLKYPRTLDTDYKLLEETDNKYVFVPSVEEIYPEPDMRQFTFGTLDTVMEGKFRPRHFNGVAQVVSRLLEIVQPNRSYFGEKDFQQLAIIRELVNQLKLNTVIVPCPIVREKDGLAMSSRNTRLSVNQRKEAVAISRILFESKNIQKNYSVDTLKTWVIEHINNFSELHTEYFEIVDGFTLQSIKNWNETEYPVGCIAVYAGDVRLIDNISYL